MNTLFDERHIQFLRPRPPLQELAALLDARERGTIEVATVGGADLPADPYQAAFLDRLAEQGFLGREERGAYRCGYRLTAKGSDRLSFLMVDYFQEILRLADLAGQVVRRKLHGLYEAGARRVAFYPVSETAEVVYTALQGSGLRLEFAADDDESKWGGSFHGVEIGPPSSLRKDRVDTVLVTTCAFREDILRRLGPAKESGLRVEAFL